MNDNEMMRRVAAGIQNQSFGKLLGLQVEEAEEGPGWVISCQKRDDLLQQTGLLHGGVTGALCEAAAGYAGLTVLPEGYSVIGVEYKINFPPGHHNGQSLCCGQGYQAGASSCW